MNISEFLQDERLFVFLLVVVILSLPWKGVALWKAANRKEKKWFIALLIINSVAILEMFYLFYWIKRKEERDERFGRI